MKKYTVSWTIKELQKIESNGFGNCLVLNTERDAVFEPVLIEGFEDKGISEKVKWNAVVMSETEAEEVLC
jgi:hypothetical protein